MKNFPKTFPKKKIYILVIQSDDDFESWINAS